jgi:hypothetical protein
MARLMPVQLGVEARLDRESAQKLATEIRALVKQAVHDGITDALTEIRRQPLP